MHQYIHDNPKSLQGFCEAVKMDGEQMTGYLMDLLAPSGYAVHMARIQGTGKMMLTISGKNQPLNLMNVRTNEKEEYDWKDLKDILHRLIMDTDPETCWGALYEEPYPPAEEEKEARRQRRRPAGQRCREPRKTRNAKRGKQQPKSRQLHRYNRKPRQHRSRKRSRKRRRGKNQPRNPRRQVHSRCRSRRRMYRRVHSQPCGWRWGIIRESYRINTSPAMMAPR